MLNMIMYPSILMNALIIIDRTPWKCYNKNSELYREIYDLQDFEIQ